MSKSRRQPPTFYLYDNAHRSFRPIVDGTICGRTEGQLQFPEDRIVSRVQCQFRIKGQDIYVEDLNSTNRTRVNSVPIRPNARRRIQLNDVIEFGRQRLVLTNQAAHPPASVTDRATRIYSARRRQDGSLTSEEGTSVTGSLDASQGRQHTRVMIDRSSFQRLRLRELIVQAPRRRILILGQGITAPVAAKIAPLTAPAKTTPANRARSWAIAAGLGLCILAAAFATWHFQTEVKSYAQRAVAAVRAR